PLRKRARPGPGGRQKWAREGAPRAAGDPLEIVRQLPRHRRLVAGASLREAGQPRADDEPLPVRRQLGGELFEEPRTDRPRADEAHLADEHVPKLRDLVELCRTKPTADPCRLFLRASHELLAEIRAEPLLRAA